MPIQILFMFEPCTLASGLFMYFLQILCTALPMLGKTLSKVRNVPLESFKIQPGVEHHKSKIGPLNGPRKPICALKVSVFSLKNFLD